MRPLPLHHVLILSSNPFCTTVILSPVEQTENSVARHGDMHSHRSGGKNVSVSNTRGCSNTADTLDNHRQIRIFITFGVTIQDLRAAPASKASAQRNITQPERVVVSCYPNQQLPFCAQGVLKAKVRRAGPSVLAFDIAGNKVAGC